MIFVLQKAFEKGIPVMKKSWVDDIWKKNLVSYVKATESSIINEYKVPIFYKLKVTPSGLNESERRELKSAICENGKSKASTKAFPMYVIVMLSMFSFRRVLQCRNVKRNGYPDSTLWQRREI